MTIPVSPITGPSRALASLLSLQDPLEEGSLTVFGYENTSLSKPGVLRTIGFLDGTSRHVGFIFTENPEGHYYLFLEGQWANASTGNPGPNRCATVTDTVRVGRCVISVLASPTNAAVELRLINTDRQETLLLHRGILVVTEDRWQPYLPLDRIRSERPMTPPIENNDDTLDPTE